MNTPHETILITGGAGFIGSHLTERLLGLGRRVVVVDDLSTGSRENLAAVQDHPNLTFVEGSAGDAALMEELLEPVDTVFHLAAAVGVALIARQPIDSIRRNIFPTDTLFSLLNRRHLDGKKVRCFLAGTSETYGNSPGAAWNEEAPLVFGSTTCSRWSYGVSKAIDEFLALAYWRQHRLPVVIGRLFNVVGPRQSGAYGMVLPRLVEAALAGRPLPVYDDGKQIRCFAHVRDIVEMLLLLTQSDQSPGRVFNVGDDRPVAILELARRVIELVNPRATIAFLPYEEAYDRDFQDVRRRVPDLSRLRQTIDYRPRYDLDRIILDTAEQKRGGK